MFIITQTILPTKMITTQASYQQIILLPRLLPSKFIGFYHQRLLLPWHLTTNAFHNPGILPPKVINTRTSYLQNYIKKVFQYPGILRTKQIITKVYCYLGISLSRLINIQTPFTACEAYHTNVSQTYPKVYHNPALSA